MLSYVALVLFSVAVLVMIAFLLYSLWCFGVLLYTGTGFADPTRKRQGLQQIKRMAGAGAVLLVLGTVGRMVLSTATP